MAIYDFTHIPRASVRVNSGTVLETRPALDLTPIAADHNKKKVRLYDQTNVNVPEDLSTIITPAFLHIDGGIKSYFSDIMVPTKDDIRPEPMDVRIAGGDKSILIFKQDLTNGRIRLPVMSINRQNFEFLAVKFSPPYYHTQRRFVESDGSRVKLSYRPKPVLVDYNLSIWANRKRDVEYVLHQIYSRFSPLAEFFVETETLRGKVILKWNNWTDASDVDIGAEELAKVRYEITVSAEAWIPLPVEKIVPTVLGKVKSFSDLDTGEFLEFADEELSALDIGDDNVSFDFSPN